MILEDASSNLVAHPNLRHGGKKMNNPYDYWAARDVALSVEFARPAFSNAEVFMMAAAAAVMMAAPAFAFLVS